MKHEVSSSKYTALILDIRTFFSKAKKDIYKGRNSLKVLAYTEQNIVIKSFKIPHLINKIAYSFFRESKAKKSYKNAVKISEFTPEAIGYVEFFRFGLLYDSYFVCKEYVYDFTIREVLVEKDFKDRENILKAFATFTYAVHNYNIEHLDYSPGNILIKEDQGTYSFNIIDVNRMQFKRMNDTQRVENFSKLWASDEDLTQIIKYYAKEIEMDEQEALTLALKASQKHKDKKNLKKRLKGKKVVD